MGRGLSRAPLAATVLAFALVAPSAAPPRARADAHDALRAARAAYALENYAAVVVALEPPVLEGRVGGLMLELEARELLGAAYALLGRDADADRQFRALLRDDPAHTLDPAAFPELVVSRFEAVRAALPPAADDAEEDVAALRERLRAVVELAEADVVIELERSRWLAVVPFGVGQFENGDEALGAFFFAAELLATLELVGTGIAHGVALQDASENPYGAFVQSGEAARVTSALEIANWSGAGVLAALVIAGAIEAEVSLRPRRVAVPRPRVPPELRGALDVAIGPGGARLRLSF